MMMTAERTWTMDAIKAANERAGLYYFSRATMKFFQSRVGSAVYQGPGGVFFVTSEQFVGSDGSRGPRNYTVRQFDPETSDVRTAPFCPFNEWSKAKAHEAAKKLSQYGPPASMPFDKVVGQ